MALSNEHGSSGPREAGVVRVGKVSGGPDVARALEESLVLLLALLVVDGFRPIQLLDY